jgi:L-ribulose-5-phosphate 4-epimerase
MLEKLKQDVYEANMELNARGVVIFTWGNVSGIDRASGLVAIKPSGVDYETMTPEDMVIVDLDGNIVEGRLKPSSDTPTHLFLYHAFPKAGGIAHTHSEFAASFAQAGLDIPALGTTHADVFFGPVPCTRSLSEAEVRGEYEKNTGAVIAETFAGRGFDPAAVPGVLVNNHGPFTWGKDAAKAVYNAVTLEKVAAMAYRTLMLDPAASMPGYVLEKHYYRKHGKNAYYGQ